MSQPRILVLFATFAESERFMAVAPANVNVVVCGVGATAAAISAMRFIDFYKPDLVILAGIAGAFDGGPTRLEVGQCVKVSSEYNGDLGSFSGGNFEAKFAQELECNTKIYSSISDLRGVRSLCVNSAATPFVSSDGFDIENMEGWGVFRVCADLQIEFVEIRSISNFVGEPFEKWNLPLALDNLTTQLQRLISKL